MITHGGCSHFNPSSCTATAALLEPAATCAASSEIYPPLLLLGTSQAELAANSCCLRFFFFFFATTMKHVIVSYTCTKAGHDVYPANTSLPPSLSLSLSSLSCMQAHLFVALLSASAKQAAFLFFNIIFLSLCNCLRAGCHARLTHYLGHAPVGTR